MDSTPDKTHLMDAEEISALIDKIAQEICDKNKYANQDDFVFIGIHRGGVPLAERLVKSIEKKACFLPPLGTLDIFDANGTPVASLPLLAGESIPHLTWSELFCRLLKLAYCGV